MNGRPLGEVPVDVVLEGAEGLQLVGHPLLNGTGGDPEVFKGQETNGFIGELTLKVANHCFKFGGKCERCGKTK